MMNIKELAEEAALLMESIVNFGSQATMIDSRIALGLWSLERSMYFLMDQIEELALEEEFYE